MTKGPSHRSQWHSDTCVHMHSRHKHTDNIEEVSMSARLETTMLS